MLMSENCVGMMFYLCLCARCHSEFRSIRRSGSDSCCRKSFEPERRMNALQVSMNKTRVHLFTESRSTCERRPWPSDLSWFLQHSELDGFRGIFSGISLFCLFSFYGVSSVRGFSPVILSVRRGCLPTEDSLGHSGSCTSVGIFRFAFPMVLQSVPRSSIRDFNVFSNCTLINITCSATSIP